MRLTRFHIHALRNIHEITLTLHPHFNLFLGANGSGKTSILEGIHLLALGRSFRTRQSQTVINHQQNQLACFGEVEDSFGAIISMGIEKTRDGEVRCKLKGELCDKLSQFATQLPLQLLTPETFKLLTAGPEERRRFLDWGVFHVEHTFTGLCQRYQRLLKQRNAALKQFPRSSIEAFEKELVEVGEKISHQRKQYLVSLIPFIVQAREYLLPDHDIEVHYEQGWPNTTLEAALRDALKQDQRLGYTSVGPHRAELAVNLKGFAAHQVLSRGQQKLLICALHLAQAKALYAATGRKCLFLIDDLASELDSPNRQRLIAYLAKEGHQLFLTGVEDAPWQAVCEQYEGQMFHVEHGNITRTHGFTGLKAPIESPA
ncbi:MAG: DNA replication/repair protein RecF [Proteobacteria bacterium]|nr:DNA replication/repair protein RecF [Pseudomonadota bacterium]